MAAWHHPANGRFFEHEPILINEFVKVTLGQMTPEAFCDEVGLDYVSCSPFRVPIARLAAAQAALGKGAQSTA